MAEAIEPAVPDVLTCHPQGGPDQGEWLPSSKQGTDMSQSSLTVEQNAAFLMKAKGLCRSKAAGDHVCALAAPQARSDALLRGRDAVSNGGLSPRRRRHHREPRLALRSS
jgi:hypothetical protein